MAFVVAIAGIMLPAISAIELAICSVDRQEDLRTFDVEL